MCVGHHFYFDPGYPNLWDWPGKPSEYRTYENPKIRVPTEGHKLLAQDILKPRLVKSGESQYTVSSQYTYPELHFTKEKSFPHPLA